MKLLDLQNGETKVWEEKGYLLPKYDREELKKKTKENPTWVHFGAGNIFRAFPAAKLQDWHTSICGFVAAGGERGDGNPIAVRCCAGGIFVDGQAPPIGTACAARFVRRGMLCAAGVGDSLSAGD